MVSIFKPTLASASITFGLAMFTMFVMMLLPAWGGLPIDPAVAVEDAGRVWERGFGPFVILVAGVEFVVILWLIKDMRAASTKNHAMRDKQTDVLMSMAREVTTALVNASAQAVQITHSVELMNDRLERIERNMK
jgi:hypothetical protein